MSGIDIMSRDILEDGSICKGSFDRRLVKARL